jgi:hypothetical protein
VGSQAPPRASRHAGGAENCSNVSDLHTRDKHAAPATMAKPCDHGDRRARSPGRHDFPRRQRDRRRQTDGSSVLRDRGAAAATREDRGFRTRERVCGSNAFAPPIDRSSSWHTPLRVATSCGRNRLPRRAVQGFNAYLPRRNEQAGNLDPETLAVQRPPSQTSTRRLPLVRVVTRGSATRGEGDRSGEARRAPLAPSVIVVLSSAHEYAPRLRNSRHLRMAESSAPKGTCRFTAQNLALIAQLPDDGNQ